jgi:hypothetical protein
VQHAFAALAADPGASVRFGLAILEDRDRAIHAGPAAAVTMLKAWAPFPEDPEPCRLDHVDLARFGSTVGSMISNGWSVFYCKFPASSGADTHESVLFN